MKRIALFAKILVGLAFLFGVWHFRAPLGEWFGWSLTSGKQMASAELHAGQAMPDAAKQREDEHTSHAATSKAERKILYWQDPMHPSYRSDKPGTAPDCGMKLVPVYAEPSEPMAQLPEGTVQLTAEKQQLLGVTLGRAEMRPVNRNIRAVAKIAFDESRIVHAHTKVDGWIEQIFAEYVGAPVTHGQPLFTIYSPELLSAQQEYLIAIKAKREFANSPTPEIARSTEALYEAAREKLRLWDVSEDQIRKLEETGKPERTVTFYADHHGIVMERKAYQHMRVEKNTDLYMIADLSRVWAIAEVYEFEAPFVAVGQPARMTLMALPGRTFRGKVSFIYPQLDSQTRTLKVRLDFDNPDMQLRPEMFANVELDVSLGRQLVVPEQAVLDSGLKQYVFLNKGNGYFEPRQVRVLLRADGFASIEAGLKAGDQVVTSANFLIDSESKLKAAAGTAGHQH